MKIASTTRKSLPLSERDLEDLRTLRGSPDQRAALAEVTGTEIGEKASDAFLLHAVWEAGIKAIRDQLEDRAYAEMAAQQDVASRRASARRRQPSWADEP
jgi:TfoX/Sxy family transcriptional regulator of competence genes